MTLERLSDEVLLEGLRAACREANVISARVLAYLVEVEDRSLHKRIACPSLFDFCVRMMKMSESAACRRIKAARLVKRFPRLLPALERGDIHLSTLDLVAAHLTDANVDELIAEVSGKSKREIEEVLARRAPKPDVPSMICALPPLAEAIGLDTPAPSATPATKPQTRIAPLSPTRHALQLTITGETRAKLERAQQLMRHTNPSGDLASIVDRALDALLAKLEKTRLAKTDRPRPSRGTRKGKVSRATRREVFERDGDQCTFRDTNGNRCPSRDFLELDHVVPRALGGSDDAANLRVTCRGHNSLHAEEVFGKSHMRRFEQPDLRQRRSAPATPPPAPMDPTVLARGLRGLVGLGFHERDARRALDAICARHAGATSPPAIEQLVREAISALT